MSATVIAGSVRIDSTGAVIHVGSREAARLAPDRLEAELEAHVLRLFGPAHLVGDGQRFVVLVTPPKPLRPELCEYAASRRGVVRAMGARMMAEQGGLA